MDQLLSVLQAVLALLCACLLLSWGAYAPGPSRAFWAQRLCVLGILALMALEGPATGAVTLATGVFGLVTSRLAIQAAS